jgi:hypothetical protein
MSKCMLFEKVKPSYEKITTRKRRQTCQKLGKITRELDA